MKLGIGTYTYMWSIGFPGAAPDAPMRAMGLLEKARELGRPVLDKTDLKGSFDFKLEWTPDETQRGMGLGGGAEAPPVGD